MNDDAAREALSGQFGALALVLQSVICALPPSAAGLAANALEDSLNAKHASELADPEASDVTIATEQALADAYLQLLRARSRLLDG